MNEEKLIMIVEAALLAAGRPLTLDNLLELFADNERPDKGTLRKAIDALGESYAARGIEVKEVASGFRLQVKQEMEPWVSRLWEERPVRYSRALLETLALIAYRQPITRGEIEDIRGVSVSSNIIKTLLEREWVRVVGHRDVPGRPSMYGTTREFLDYFNLKGLSDLPPLSELRDIDTINAELDLALPGEERPAANQEGSGETTLDIEAEAGELADSDEQTTPEAEGAEAVADAGDDEAEEGSADAPEATAEMGVDEAAPVEPTVDALAEAAAGFDEVGEAPAPAEDDGERGEPRPE